MNKELNEVIKQLDADLSRSAVKSRSQGGAALSYVDTYYVIKRLNECFGNLGWDSETVDMVLVSNPGDKAAYRAKVRITAIVATGDGGYMKVCKEGTGWGSDKSTNNAHEMACKEAESDALKRAAMKFGMSLGLALYDKSQENVEDAPKGGVKSEAAIRYDLATKAVAQAAKPAPTQTVAPTPERGDVTPKEGGRESVNKRITAMSNVILAKAGPSGAPERAAKAAELKALVASKGAETKEALTDAKAAELLTALEAMANA